MSEQSFESRLNEFLEKLTQLYIDYYATHFACLTIPTLSAESGIKNVKIVVDNSGQRSVYCFIEKSTGNIYKAASWKAPAKGIRGSIWNANCDVGVKADMNGSGLYR